MALGRKTGGRQKGTPNKLTTTVKQAIEQAAENLGGPARLAAWAQESPENERVFWTSIYPKLLPLQARLTHDVPDPMAELFDYVAKHGRRIGE